MKIINIEDMSFSYNDRSVIKNASFTIQKGDFVCITGPNGAGKSTLLRLMLNIIKPDSGCITINSGSKISYVSQRASAFNTSFPATVSEIVSLGLYRRYGILKNFGHRDADEVAAALEKVGMSNHRNSLIGRLSGGQQQRAFIAKALVNNPDIIFLDEPTVGIDADMVGSICCLLGNLNRDYSITILMVTHDINSIMGHANKILNFDINGNIRSMDIETYKELHTFDEHAGVQ